MNPDFPISMSEEFLVKSIRSLTNKEIYKLLDEVLVNIDTFESFEKLVCLVFYIRDFFIGRGEKRLFHHFFIKLHLYYPKLIEDLIVLIPVYGCWKDLKIIWELSENINLKIKIENLFTQTLLNDNKLNHPETYAAKWAPRENNKYKSLACAISKKCFPTQKAKNALKSYRKMLTSLNLKLDTLETTMCNGKWSEINFKKLTSQQRSKYHNAFLNISKDKKGKWINKYDSLDRQRCELNYIIFLNKELSNYKTIQKNEPNYNRFIEYLNKDYFMPVSLIFDNHKEFIVIYELYDSNDLSVPIKVFDKFLDNINIPEFYKNTDLYEIKYCNQDYLIQNGISSCYKCNTVIKLNNLEFTCNCNFDKYLINSQNNIETKIEIDNFSIDNLDKSLSDKQPLSDIINQNNNQVKLFSLNRKDKIEKLINEEEEKYSEELDNLYNETLHGIETIKKTQLSNVMNDVIDETLLLRENEINNSNIEKISKDLVDNTINKCLENFELEIESNKISSQSIQNAIQELKTENQTDNKEDILHDNDNEINTDIVESDIVLINNTIPINEKTKDKKIEEIEEKEENNSFFKKIFGYFY